MRFGQPAYIAQFDESSREKRLVANGSMANGFSQKYDSLVEMLCSTAPLTEAASVSKSTSRNHSGNSSPGCQHEQVMIPFHESNILQYFEQDSKSGLQNHVDAASAILRRDAS